MKEPLGELWKKHINPDSWMRGGWEEVGSCKGRGVLGGVPEVGRGTMFNPTATILIPIPNQVTFWGPRG